jgi:hypothetical protein
MPLLWITGITLFSTLDGQKKSPGGINPFITV